ncbi:MAG: hypothetical protein H0X64_13800 [Gemmatimonadaceae bacterium]|nr:hypothetical protein [Gemmatimonadaceae bacterium]
MAVDPEFGRRLRSAKRRWEERHDRKLPNDELAAAVAREAGATSLSGQAVGQWLKRGQEPASFRLLNALAAVLEVPVTELLGDHTSAAPRTTTELGERFGVSAPPAPQGMKKAAQKKAAGARRGRKG